MQRIVDFATGKLTYTQFEHMFTEDPSLWDVAQTLLTKEIMNDATHPFWSKSNRIRLESSNYSVQSACLTFGYDTYGRVVTHRMLGELLSYQYPDIVLREPPEYSQTDLREKLGMDYLGGAEVDYLIDDVLSKKSTDSSLTKFISNAKQELRILFHLAPRKHPQWAQEPEWPMGQNTPMAFVSQKRSGDLVQFTFRDVDTEEIKIIEQLY